MKWIAPTLLVLASLTDAAGADQNRLPNGGFDNPAMTSGWSCGSIFGSVAWSTDDAGALPDSGAIELSAAAYGDTSWYQGLEVCDSTCFAVRPRAAYAYGADSRLVAAAGGVGSSFAMHFTCGVYAQAACAGSPQWLPEPVLAMASTWSAPNVVDGVLPSDAVSAACQVQAIADGENGSGTGHFDNLFFTTDSIFANGYE